MSRGKVKEFYDEASSYREKKTWVKDCQEDDSYEELPGFFRFGGFQRK
jgi:hypothetical protein